MSPARDQGLVSVITPAWRARATLARAVRSVLAQSWHHWEMLIVSDDGEDYRAALAWQGIDDPRLRFLSSGGDGVGPAAARNVALAAARGDFIAPLDADDAFHPERLACLLPLAARHGVAGDNPRVVEEASGRILGTAFPVAWDALTLDLAGYTHVATPLTFLFQRTAIPAPWDADLRFGEDTLFNLRALEAAGGRCPLLCRPLHDYRVRSGSVTNAPDAADLAERTYRHSLARLRVDGLGLHTAAGRANARVLLERRRRMNDLYRRSAAVEPGLTFQQFAAGRGDLVPLAVQEAVWGSARA